MITLLKKLLIAAMVFAGLGLISLALVHGYSEGYYGPNKIGFEKSYLGIKIGDSKADVYFAHGKPTLIGTIDGETKTHELLIYQDSRESKKFYINSKGAVQMIKMSSTDDSVYIKPLKWIKWNTTPADLIKRLNAPHEIINFDQGLRREYFFKENNIRVGFEKKELRWIEIRAPSLNLDALRNQSGAITITVIQNSSSKLP